VTKTKGNQGFPVFLPDGHHFLYVERGGGAEDSGIYVSSLDEKEHRRVLPDVSDLVFAPSAPGSRSGHILFVRENTLVAAPFDAASVQVSGDVFPVAEGISLTNAARLPVTVSDSGMLLYATGTAAGGTNQIGWYDRTGTPLGAVGAPGNVRFPSISPDEKSIAFVRGAGIGTDLWVHDLNREGETRFTSDASSNNVAPFWSPKGDHIVFGSNRTGVYNLYQKSTSGSGQDEPLLPNGNARIPSQWSRDGLFIVYFEIDTKNKRDIWVLPTEGSDRKPIPFLKTEADEFMGQLSPDSRWMAFTSDRSGRREVYVRPFPPGEGEVPISLAGGQAPRWRRDGQELFFEAADGKLMAVLVKAFVGVKTSFEVGAPVALFDAHMARVGVDVSSEYDVTPDGKRFLINTVVDSGTASAPTLTVVTNWLAATKK
jgi:Tol biopolymer transport system component